MTSQLRVSLGKMGFGCMGLTAFYGPAVPNAHGVAVMRAAFDGGCRMFDTAEIYQQFGEQVPGTYRYNEELVGAFIKSLIGDGKARDEFVIATKFFPRRDEESTPTALICSKRRSMKVWRDWASIPLISTMSIACILRML
mmetsp:Transcript_4343/g.9802  ORF Transcript_4343/g.9802 Transcript_4343/m.9802 type:complete len:140 (+) Transcript_4343:138-557(+)